MKVAKPIVILGHYIGRRSCCIREHRLSCDKETKKYIRHKRQHKGLPDSWDTKFINVRQFRNWKHRCKKKFQWEKHKQTPKEIKFVTGEYPDEFIMELYGGKRWRKIEWEHHEDVNRLVKQGKLTTGILFDFVKGV